MSDAIKERPILFSAPMVRALIAGNKTQTRRICKPAMAENLSHVIPAYKSVAGEQCPANLTPGWFGDEEGDVLFACPYGQPGDRLWVRESFWGCDMPGYGDQPCVVYDDEWIDKEYQPAEARPWARKFGRIPSIHMPRDSSRILLEIVSVRVERLQDISEVDAIAEGSVHIRSQAWDRQHFPAWRYLFDEACAAGNKPPVGPSPKQAYEALWESINGAGSWDANPWVWVVEFRRVAP
jgi:hypothetical protein